MAPTSPPTQTPMDPKQITGITVYLLASTILTVYAVFTLWSAQSKLANTGPAPVPICGGIGAPRLTNLYPIKVAVNSAVDLTIGGCLFPASTTVKLNGAPHQAAVVNANYILLKLTAADVATSGSGIVTLSNAGVDYGTGSFTVLTPPVLWNPLWFIPLEINPEVQLLLMVLFTGAFGSSVYALKSLADYRGDGKLYQTWATFYGIQPFEGAGIAFLLYLVIRGGFLAGAGGDVKSVNQFSICAIAGLAGAFSDTAFLKLREVFQTLFKPQDDRGGKDKPKILTNALPPGIVGKEYRFTLQASGGTAPLSWSVAPQIDTIGLQLDSGTGLIHGTPKDPPSKTAFKFTVTDGGKPASTDAKELTIEIQAAGAAHG